MRLLAIEASGLTAAWALTEDGRLVAEYRTDHLKTHSQTLMPMLDDLCRMTQLDPATLDAIVVSAGPGSFTGLRIGASTAKGMGFALQIPLVPVPTLDAMAWQLCGETGTICPMMDARRGQVYAGLYSLDAPSGGNAGRIEDLRILREGCAAPVEEILEAVNTIGEPCVFLGDGVPVYEDVIRDRAAVPWRIAPSWKCRQSAAALAALGELYFRAGRTVSADAFVPVYLRASQAERERAAAQDTGGLVFRAMAPQDAGAAAELEKLCLGSEAWNERQLEEAADRRDTVYVMAELDGRQIAHAGLRAVAGEGEITGVCVHPDFRRQGIGEKLLQSLLAKRADAGVSECTLEVRSRNEAAIRLYNKLGFQAEGVRPGFYTRPDDDAVIYWLR